MQDGGVKTSSDPSFGQAVSDQVARTARGTFLVIQEPVHGLNSRHVPKPEVRILSSGLAPSERGAGQIVAARLEFSSAKVLDRVGILYTSEPMDTARLERLLNHRVGLVFASEKGHRTAVYVVFRLSDRFELLGSFPTLPRCCCGGQFCV
jgi:hypothetical protein